MKRKRVLWLPVYILLLFAFTAYSVLDTFVITRVYSAVETESAQSAETTAEETVQPQALSVTAEPVVTNNSYNDGSTAIELSSYRVKDTTVYVADVTLGSSSSLQTALAQNSYGRNVTEKTSAIAGSVNAILAINGDYYGSQETGYVIRNGVLYRDVADRDREDLVIYADGSFDIIRESQVTARELIDAGAQQVLSFGPALVQDGAVTVREGEEVGKAKASNPRTAIGILGDKHYVFVVSDGRTEESEGLSLYELAQFMESLGCTMAYNLDGGGSSTMVFNGSVVNKPTSGRGIKERSVSDIVCITV